MGARSINIKNNLKWIKELIISFPSSTSETLNLERTIECAKSQKFIVITTSSIVSARLTKNVLNRKSLVKISLFFSMI